MKNKPINKEFRENIIEEASIKFSNTKIDKYKEKTKDVSIKKEEEQKVEQSSLITNKPEKVLKSYNFIIENNVYENEDLQLESNLEIIQERKVLKKQLNIQPKKALLNDLYRNDGEINRDCNSCLAECSYNNISPFCQTYECIGTEPACQMCAMEMLNAQQNCGVTLEA